MAFSDSWVETDPDGDVITVSLLDDSDRLIKRALRERIEGDVADVLTGLLESGSFAAAPKPRKGACRAHVTTDAGVAALTNEDGRFVITSDGKRLWHIATAGDAELDYVPSTGTPKTITAVHTFNPTVAGAPFTLGANATGQLVTGLNADLLDGQSGSFYQNADNLNAGSVPAARLGVGAVRVVGRDNSPNNLTGTLVETTMATISVPAGLLGAGGWLRITGLLDSAGVAGTKEIRVKYGGTLFANQTWNAATVLTDGMFEVWIANLNATNSQSGRGWMQPASGGAITPTATIGRTGAVDSTAAQNVEITGTLGNVGDTLTLNAVVVEAMPS